MTKQKPINADLLIGLKFRSTSTSKYGETFAYEVDDRLQITVWISADQKTLEVMLVFVGTGARELLGMDRSKLTHLVMALEPVK